MTTWRVERSESVPKRLGDPAPIWTTLYNGRDEARAREVFAACYGVMRKTAYLVLSFEEKPVHKVFFNKRIISVW